MARRRTSDYGELLRDPRWQRKRLEVLAKFGWACMWCENKDSTLHVHHAYYEKNAAPWEYDNDSLLSLCEDCHEKAERERKLLIRYGGLASSCGYGQRAIGYLSTLYALAAGHRVMADSDQRALGVADALFAQKGSLEKVSVARDAEGFVNPTALEGEQIREWCDRWESDDPFEDTLP